MGYGAGDMGCKVHGIRCKVKTGIRLSAFGARGRRIRARGKGKGAESLGHGAWGRGGYKV